MITVTVNLENEQVLQEDVRGLFAALTTEQVQEIASKALWKYLTDTVDYEKQEYINASVKESREKGIPNNSNYYSKSAEEIASWDDKAIIGSQAFQEKYMKGYKSAKESRFDAINTLLEEQLTEKVKGFVKTNEELTKMVEAKQEAIAEDFENLVKEVFFKVMGGLVIGTVQKAQYAHDTSGHLTAMVNDLMTNRQY